MKEKFEVIPAIDLLQGKAVRLEQGDFKKVTVYSERPVEVAKQFEKAGATRLHIVDLEGARVGTLQEKENIERIVKSISIPVEVGGGIRETNTIQQLLTLGVDRVILGTSALKNPSLIQQACKQFGKNLYISLDAKKGNIATEGWVETSSMKATEWIKEIETWGVQGIIYTDISRDGMLQGPNFEAIQALAQSTPLPIIASGGISTKKDVEKLKQLATLGVIGCIIGKALYTGALQLKDLHASK